MLNGAIKHISKLSRLSKLQLEEWVLDKASIDTINSMKNVKYLDLGYTNLDDELLDGLLQMPLKQLDISHTKVTDKGLIKIAKQIKTLDRLEITPFGGEFISDKARAEFRKFSKSTTLKDGAL